MAMSKSIVRIPNGVLSKKAERVKAFDRNLCKLVVELKENLLASKNPKGVGLAAPQIGVSKRVFTIKPTESSQIRVFVNPKILKRSKEETHAHDKRLEGCLSIPNIWGKVKRAERITIAYEDEHGIAHEETFTGFPAVIIQHEMDHLDGVLFTQKVLEQNGKLYSPTKNENGEDVFEEIKV